MRGFCVLVVVVASATEARAEDGPLSMESTNLWDNLEEACAALAKVKDKQAFKTARPTAAPVVDYCVDQVYPLALIDGDADTVRDAFDPFPKRADGSTLTTAITTNGAVPAVGGVADTLARGLATVLIKRAKVELQSFLVTTIQDKVCSNTSVKGLVDNTCSYLGSADGTFGVTLGPALRSAVVADVAAMPSRVLSIAANKGGAAALGASVLFTMVTSLLDRADIKVLGKKLKALGTGWNCTGDTTCDKVKAGLDRACRALEIASSVAERVLKAEKASADKQVPADVLADLVKLVQSGVKQKLGLDISEAQAIELRDSVTVAMSSARAWLSASRSARSELTGQMLRSIIGLVGVAFDLAADQDVELTERLPRVVTDASAMAEAIASADLGSVFTLALTHLRRLTMPKDYESAVRVLALGVELTSAKTADEVAATIETVAAPMGSYRRKLIGPSRAVGGFVGFGVGFDRVEGVSRDLAPIARSVGPIGLVGADLTWALRKQQLVAGAFISLFDLGAVFADQQKKGMSESAPIQLEQLVSLGAHGRVGTNWTGPLVLHGGVSWIPNYRETNGSQRDVIRVLVGVSVDVTLFPF